MQRRRFLAYLCRAPIVSYAVITMAACSDEQTASMPADAPVPKASTDKFQTFGYYEGLGQTETRDPSRTDGTTYNMPCLTAADIAAAVEKTYEFWHGHDGMQHRFTVTKTDFNRLKSGQSVEIFTSVVEDHRHALLLSPVRRCENKVC